MTDDRIERLLRAAEDVMTPAPDFAEALLADLRVELGFKAAGAGAAGAGRSSWRARPLLARRATRQRSRRLELLLVAAIVVAALLGVAIAAGGLRVDLPTNQGDPLARIQALGRVRIAIRPDHPQFQTGVEPAAGFDADVAFELGRHMGVASMIVIVPATSMTRVPPSGTWDVGLPSVASWTIDPSVFELSAPYYAWPHRVLVSSTSTATNIDDIANRPVCAVEGDAGAAWLMGLYGRAPSSPVTTTAVTRATDEECFASLAEGSVAAVVTAHVSDADIAVRPGIRILDPGPEPEARVAIVPRITQAAERSALVQAIDAAFAAMRSDGTLTTLSQNRFGGADLTRS